METFGSQKRELLSESGMTLVSQDEDEAILKDEDGKQELWFQKDDSAGYVIVIDGIGYEFARTIN